MTILENCNTENSMTVHDHGKKTEAVYIDYKKNEYPIDVVESVASLPYGKIE